MRGLSAWRARGGELAAASSVAVALAALVACGPSYQAIYEGDSRFEHCYALEETGAVTMGQKSDCWHDWTPRYTYGQTRDRVEYAYTRYRALTRAPEAPTDEAMMEAAPGEGRPSSIAAPAPTNAFAPPPKTLAEQVDAGDTSSDLPGYADAAIGPVRAVEERAASPAPPPETDCTAACEGGWARCKQTEKCDGGPACGCSRGYKRCMRGCFAK